MKSGRMLEVDNTDFSASCLISEIGHLLYYKRLCSKVKGRNLEKVNKIAKIPLKNQEVLKQFQTSQMVFKIRKWPEEKNGSTCEKIKIATIERGQPQCAKYCKSIKGL